MAPPPSPWPTLSLRIRWHFSGPGQMVVSARSHFTHQRVFHWLPVSEYPLPAHRRHSLGLPVRKPFSFTHRMGPLALSVSRTAISLSRINCPVLPPAIYQASGPQAMPDTIYNFARQSKCSRYRKNTGQNATKVPVKTAQKHRTKCHKSTEQLLDFRK